MNSLFDPYEPPEKTQEQSKGEPAPDHEDIAEKPWLLEEHPRKEYRPYAGVGSRSTPMETQKEMAAIARSLGDEGWVLRSGGADGADSAFAWGAGLAGSGYREIYVPYEGWRGKSSVHHHSPPGEAFQAAREAWRPYARRTEVPPWDDLKTRTAQFMARNACQILGPNLDRPSAFVVCWTPDGISSGENTTTDTGGTGMAIRLASQHDVPVFNLNDEDHRTRIVSALSAKSTS